MSTSTFDDPRDEGRVYYDEVKGEFVLDDFEDQYVLAPESADDSWWEFRDIEIDPETLDLDPESD